MTTRTHSTWLRSALALALMMPLYGIAATLDGAPSAETGATAAVTGPRSLIGTSLRNPAWSPETLAFLEKDVEIARAAMKIAPEREDSYIWLGRRLAYLNRFDEAIAVFTQGLERFPDSYKLLRFRGRKLARSRQFDAALADYARGIALIEPLQDSYEPDGIVNARNQFLGSYRSNLHYYHAQTSWAIGDYATTLAGMERSAREPLVQNQDHQVAIRYWRYLALRKLGRHDEAAQAVADTPAGLELLENDSYYDGVRYLQGALAEDVVLARKDPVSSFAVAMQHLFQGDAAGADALLERIILDSPQGFWPAETELLKLRSASSR
jgi:tetratricopeptide (TPR) repeat protein